MSPCTLYLALQMLLNSPMLDSPPIIEPAIADGTPMQIDPLSTNDLDQMLRKSNRPNDNVIAFASVRVGFSADEKWLPLLGQCEVGKTADLALLLTNSRLGITVNVLRLEKFRHRIIN